jgi:hypothetical protein
MSSRTDDPLDSWDPNAEMVEFDKLSLVELLEWSKSFHERGLRKRYGREIVALSADDERLLAYVESGAPRLQRMALCSLIHLRYIWCPQIVAKCAEYLEFGKFVDIRGLCIDYLCRVLVYEHDDQIIGLLQRCARRLREFRTTRDDDCVVKMIDVVLLELESPREPGDGKGDGASVDGDVPGQPGPQGTDI